LAQAVDEGRAARSATPGAAGRQQIERHKTDLSWRFRLVELFRGRRLASSLALTTTALLIGCGVTWLAIETSRLREQLAKAQRESEIQHQRTQTQAQQIATLEAQVRGLTEERDHLQAQRRVAEETGSLSPHVAPAPVFFALSISSFRDPGSQEPRTLIIPLGVREVWLQLNLAEPEFPSYQVTLFTADGRKVFSRKGLRSRATQDGDSVMISIPARKFVGGEHVLALSGISATGEVENLGKALIKVSRP
jgi:cell division protein FtsB